jgi:hypothetical protein
MGLKHESGHLFSELNAKKGIWCEWCGKDCQKEHLITITSTCKEYVKELVCVNCAQDMVKCLQRSLMDAVLTDKEN